MIYRSTDSIVLDGKLWLRALFMNLITHIDIKQTSFLHVGKLRVRRSVNGSHGGDVHSTFINTHAQQKPDGRCINQKHLVVCIRELLYGLSDCCDTLWQIIPVFLQHRSNILTQFSVQLMSDHYVAASERSQAYLAHIMCVRHVKNIGSVH